MEEGTAHKTYYLTYPFLQYHINTFTCRIEADVLRRALVW